MQVVLLEGAKASGKKSQIVNVNGGYARNFILPKKLGVETNPKSLNDSKLKKANDDRIATEQLAVVKELGIEPDESPVTLTIKTGEDGGAFESVSSKEIGEAIGDQLGIDIDKKEIMLDGPIKSIGSFEVPVEPHKEVTAKLVIRVVET